MITAPHARLHPALWFLAPLVLAATPAAAQAPDFRTVAEKSEFRATARHADVVTLLDALAASSPLARRASLGKTTEGRDIPLLILSDPPVAIAAEARHQVESEGKVLVLAIGNIHAGEVDGKEALPMLARDLLADKDHALLRRLVLVIAPIYNADGNERVGKANRPGQVGPEEGMGIRENAEGLDLNRDAIKIEAPETAGLVAFFNEWDPHVFIDTHTTNGSYHRYILTYAGPKAPAGDSELIAWTRQAMFPAISAAFKARTTRDTFWYGNFEGAFGDAPRGHTRWESFAAEARYVTTYVGLRNRVSILTEAYSYAPFKDRVEATRDFVRCALEWAATNRDEIRRRAREMDEGKAPAREIAVRSRMAPWEKKVTVLGFEEDVVDGRSVATTRPKDYEVELWDRFVPGLTVTRPWAYALPDEPGIDKVIAKLRQHGVVVERVTSDAEAPMEIYTVDSTSPASRLFQKHALQRVEATAAKRTEKLPEGSYVVRTGQRLGTLAVYLLEPGCEDGLAAWNYFDAWLKPGTEFPARRLPEQSTVRTQTVP